MKFKVDENLPSEFAAELRAMGHDADMVMDEGLRGSAETDVMAHVRVERRVILTLDLGIADIRILTSA